jgi:hypothetical protein
MDRDERRIATTIRVPERIWTALRALAEQRALAEGGRPSVAALVVDLVEAEQRRRREGDSPS